MRTSSLQDVGEADKGLSPRTIPQASEDSSIPSVDRSSSRGVSRPRRRTTVQNSQRPSQWRRSESSEAYETPTGWGVKPRYNTSSPSLFGLGVSASSNPNDSQPPLPSLRLIASELFLIMSLYCKYTIRSVRKPFRRYRRAIFHVMFTLAVFCVLILAWMVFDFYTAAFRLCTPPADYQFSSGRPLVEYYVHGRGIGHYARSVAIVDRLNQAGIDVRMFLTRAEMWRAFHEDARSIRGDDYTGTTTAISISSLTPDYGFFETLSHLVERIVGDCEVAVSSNRYPHLVVADGDFPGMLRAEFGGIPAVGIAHGELFDIAQKPAWVKKIPTLNRAWNQQGRLNGVTNFFSGWQIATHFCFFESKLKSGVVARAPLRREVLQMAASRKQAREGQTGYITVPQLDRIKKVLLWGNSTSPSPSSNKTFIDESALQRKLVICYFRDHNGEMVVNALLDVGFDVLLFDSGYNHDMINDPTRYGVKWVIHDRKAQRHIRGMDASGVLQGNLLDRGKQTLVETRQGPDQRVTRRLLESDLRPQNQGDDGPRLIRVMDRSLFVPLMHIADGVASSAGSQLMSECIYSHMPLLALYLQEDDEQRLNVELSHHTGPCYRPQVFGASFETLASGLENTNVTNSNSPTLAQLKQFVQEVRSSRVSQHFYAKVCELTDTTTGDPKEATPVHDEDPFHGLPDAAEIILEIVKQVVLTQKSST